MTPYRWEFRFWRWLWQFAQDMEDRHIAKRFGHR